MDAVAQQFLNSIVNHREDFPSGFVCTSSVSSVHRLSSFYLKSSLSFGRSADLLGSWLLFLNVVILVIPESKFMSHGDVISWLGYCQISLRVVWVQPGYSDNVNVLAVVFVSTNSVFYLKARLNFMFFRLFWWFDWFPNVGIQKENKNEFPLLVHSGIEKYDWAIRHCLTGCLWIYNTIFTYFPLPQLCCI